MVIVGAGSGLRSGELRGLTTDRVAGGVQMVDRQLIGSHAGQPVFGPTKSAASDRSPTVVAAIKRHLKDFGPGPIVKSRATANASAMAATASDRSSADQPAMLDRLTGSVEAREAATLAVLTVPVADALSPRFG